MSRSLKFIFIGSLAVNLALAGVVAAQWSGKTSLLAPSEYAFLSQRIFVERPNDLIINFTALRAELRQVIEERKDIRLGLYFEYLPSGVSIGINDREAFVSASLLKTPFIMGILQRIERGLLDNQALLTLTEADLDPSFGSLWKQGAGYRLTVDEAIRLALQESDNTAVRALDGVVPEDLVLKVYNALDIPVDKENALLVTSPKGYASVFRCLYLSCFLSFRSSNDILSLLTETPFYDGLRAGIPRDVRFAHKIGVFDVKDGDQVVRLDCGIAYVPKRPYLLCIFAEIQDRNATPEVYALQEELSRRIYTYVREAQDYVP